MKDNHTEIKELFTDVKEEYPYDYQLEDKVVEIISRPKDYEAQLQKSKWIRRLGVTATCVLLPLYLWLLIQYTSYDEVIKLTVLTSILAMVVIGLLLTIVTGRRKVSDSIN